MLDSPLREAPRNQRAAVIPLKQESSMLDWLRLSGRLIARDAHETDSREDVEVISDFLGVDDGIGDIDYDDDEDVTIGED
ncbi:MULTISPECIES: DUF3134 domain-containing protein [Aphanizomenon]|uniref:DUF3134 domain-containing protein n=1 Tax=Aphanizomenon flos-aquae FACHB-1249 TaxID=2692889 RepID=A0ABR8IQ64_APHFL|nr:MULTISPECIES: DUF3134 domain-containing protein [Aphanizomenon]MBD2391023.1 DUF3134 domain-containing protein [Aphanizomenon flos-aquae FACHB-1171]MBD2558381.1 DUF3134 domain-containing protein [Aphanizomenon flos-aquae FACHB-1290]MBD2630796.1 DUF3134 domain-containing protein [Aphanizomenon sp. FACHB-1399]MBD2641748.1 DUF3134 domain-containing protein [Aphanizomenon sp. FACHB-1401]MBD2656117.1 DUF3134 domain-containing protein [Aphanizomenon flos-aquae FACHB-1265]